MINTLDTPSTTSFVGKRGSYGARKGRPDTRTHLRNITKHLI